MDTYTKTFCHIDIFIKPCNARAQKEELEYPEGGRTRGLA